MKIAFEVNVTDEDIEDIVVDGLEQGIGYWCCLDNRGDEFKNAPRDEPVAITSSKILLSGGKLKLIDEEGECSYEMTLDMLLNGIRLFKEKGWDIYNAITPDGINCGNLDALCMDEIFQFALFGEVLYG